MAARPLGPQLPAGPQGEGHDQPPVGGQEPLPEPVGGGQRLPAVGVGQAHEVVGRPVAGPVGVGGGQPARLRPHVAELVGPVAVAEGQHRPGRLDADRARRAGRAGGVGVVAEVAHHLGEGRGLGREQVGEGAVGGEADRLPLGLGGPGRRRPARQVAEPVAGGRLVMDGPGVVHGRVQDVQGPGDDRRARAGLADGLQGGLVPGQGSVVAHDGLLPWRLANLRTCCHLPGW